MATACKGLMFMIMLLFGMVGMLMLVCFLIVPGVFVAVRWVLRCMSMVVRMLVMVGVLVLVFVRMFMLRLVVFMGVAMLVDVFMFVIVAMLVFPFHTLSP